MAIRPLWIATAAALCAAVAVAGGAVDATDANFDSIVGGAPLALVEFYAPWCGHCKRLAPEWEKAAAAPEVEGKALFVKVDCTSETGLASRFGIQGYPTIKIFRDGELAETYEGGRTENDLVTFVVHNSGPAVVSVDTLDEWKARGKALDVSVIFFGEDSSTALAVAHAKCANALRSTVSFVHVKKSPEGESVVLHKPFDEKTVSYNGPATVDDLKEFIKMERLPLFAEIGPDNYKLYLEVKLPTLWLMLSPSNPTPESDAAKAAVESAAATLKGKAVSVWVDGDKYGQMAERLGLQTGTFPALSLQIGSANYVFSSEYTADAIVDFAQKVIDGKVARSVRSTPAPDVHTAEGLTTVVGSTFETLIGAADVDVLIEFYAPWCGHCKKLDPEYRKVAKHFEGNSGVRIAQFDASSNDYPTERFAVEGFPTIYFFPKSKGEPIAFEGSREAESIIEFVQQHTSSSTASTAGSEDL